MQPLRSSNTLQRGIAGGGGLPSYLRRLAGADLRPVRRFELSSLAARRGEELPGADRRELVVANLKGGITPR